MIKTLLAGVLIAATMTAPAPEHNKAGPEKEWKSLGECRITSYCPYCNDGEGHESSSGKELEYGDCACNWLPIGTKVSVEGDIFTVVDTCGTDAIDIFIDHDDGWCGCNLNEYRKVSILTKGGKK